MPGVKAFVQHLAGQGVDGSSLLTKWNGYVNKGQAYARDAAANLEAIAAEAGYDPRQLWVVPPPAPKATGPEQKKGAVYGDGEYDSNWAGLLKSPLTIPQGLVRTGAAVAEWLTDPVRLLNKAIQPDSNLSEADVQRGLVEPLKQLGDVGMSALRAGQQYVERMAGVDKKLSNEMQLNPRPFNAAPTTQSAVSKKLNQWADRTAEVMDKLQPNLKPTSGKVLPYRDAEGNLTMDWNALGQQMADLTGQIGTQIVLRGAGKLAGAGGRAQELLSLTGNFAPQLESTYQSIYQATGDSQLALRAALPIGAAIAVLDTHTGTDKLVNEAGRRQLTADAIGAALQQLKGKSGKTLTDASVFEAMQVAGSRWASGLRQMADAGFGEFAGETAQEGVSIGSEATLDALRGNDDLARSNPESTMRRLLSAGALALVSGGGMGFSAGALRLAADEYHPTAFGALAEAQQKGGEQGRLDALEQLKSGVPTLTGSTPAQQQRLLTQLDQMSSMLGSMSRLKGTLPSPGTAFQMYQVNYDLLPTQRQAAQDLQDRIAALDGDGPLDITIDGEVLRDSQGGVQRDGLGNLAGTPVDPAVAPLLRQELQGELQTVNQRSAYLAAEQARLSETGTLNPNLDKNLKAIGRVRVGDTVTGKAFKTADDGTPVLIGGKPQKDTKVVTGRVISLSEDGLTAGVEIEESGKDGSATRQVRMSFANGDNKLPTLQRPPAAEPVADQPTPPEAPPKPAAVATPASTVDGFTALPDGALPSAGQSVVFADEPNVPVMLRGIVTEPDLGITYAHIDDGTDAGVDVPITGEGARQLLGTIDPRLAEQQIEQRGAKQEREAEKERLSGLMRGQPGQLRTLLESLPNADLVDRYHELNAEPSEYNSNKQRLIELIGQDRGLNLSEGRAQFTDADYAQAAQTGQFSDAMVSRLLYDSAMSALTGGSMSEPQQLALDGLLTTPDETRLARVNALMDRYVPAINNYLAQNEATNEQYNSANPGQGAASGLAGVPGPSDQANAAPDPAPAPEPAGPQPVEQTPNDLSTAQPAAAATAQPGSADRPVGDGGAGRAGEPSQTASADQNGPANQVATDLATSPQPNLISLEKVKTQRIKRDGESVVEIIAQEGKTRRLLGDLIQEGGLYSFENVNRNYVAKDWWATEMAARQAALAWFNNQRIAEHSAKNPEWKAPQGFVYPEAPPTVAQLQDAQPEAPAEPTPTVAERVATKSGEVTFTGRARTDATSRPTVYGGRIIGIKDGLVQVLVTTKDGRGVTPSTAWKDANELTNSLTGTTLTEADMQTLDNNPSEGTQNNDQLILDWLSATGQPFVWFTPEGGRPGLYVFDNGGQRTGLPSSTPEGWNLLRVSRPYASRNGLDTERGWRDAYRAASQTDRAVLPFGQQPVAPTSAQRESVLKPFRGALSQSERQGVVREAVGQAALTKLVSQLRRAYPRVRIELLSDNEFINRGWFGRRGVLDNGVAYINESSATSDTPFHELGHLYALIGENELSSLWKRGYELIGDSVYLQAVRRDPFYRNLNEDQLRNEALVQAIGERAASLGEPSKVQAFMAWLSRLVRRIGEKIGLDIQPETTLDKFLDARAKELVTGQTLSRLDSEATAVQAQAEPLSQSAGQPTAQGEPIPDTGADLDWLDSHQQDRRKELADKVLTVGDDPANPEYMVDSVDADAERLVISDTMSRLTGISKFFSESFATFHNTQSIYMALYGNTDLYTQAMNTVWAARIKAKQLALPQHKIEAWLMDKLTGKTNYGVLNARQSELVTIDGSDVDGNPLSVSVPLDVKLRLAGVIRSAAKTYGKLRPGLSDTDPQQMGVVFTDPKTNKPLRLVLDEDQIGQVYDDVYENNPDTAEIMSRLHQHFDQQFPVVDDTNLLLTGKRLAGHPGYYFPISGYSDSSSPAKRDKLVDDASPLSERQGPSEWYDMRGGLLSAVTSYHNDVRSFVERGPVWHNLDSLIKRQKVRHEGKAADSLFKSIEKIRDGLALVGTRSESGAQILASGTSVAAKSYNATMKLAMGFAIDEQGRLDALKMRRRMASSIFQFNWTTQFKQASSFTSSLFTPHIDAQYVLADAGGFLRDMGLSFAQMGRGRQEGIGIGGWAAVPQTAFDKEVQDLTRDAEAGYGAAATILYRIAGKTTPDVTHFDWVDGSKETGQVMEKIRAFMDEYGSAGMMRADGAIALSLIRAAKAQAKAEGHDLAWAYDRAMRALYDATGTYDATDRSAQQLNTSWTSLSINMFSTQTNKLFNTMLQRGMEYDLAGPDDRKAALTRLLGSIAMNTVMMTGWGEIVDMAGRETWKSVAQMLGAPDREREEKEASVLANSFYGLTRMIQGVMPGVFPALAETVANAVAHQHGDRDLIADSMGPLNKVFAANFHMYRAYVDNEYTNANKAKSEMALASKQAISALFSTQGVSQLFPRIINASIDAQTPAPKPKRPSRRPTFTGLEYLQY